MLNIVVAGDYEKCKIKSNWTYGLHIEKKGFFIDKQIPITKETVASYELIEKENTTDVGGGAGAAIFSSLIFGPIGLLAAGVGIGEDIYLLEIKFVDGKRSLIKLNKNIYTDLRKTLF